MRFGVNIATDGNCPPAPGHSITGETPMPAEDQAELDREELIRDLQKWLARKQDEKAIKDPEIIRLMR